MADSSEIGRYGTLRLLKRHEPEATVAVFPIDDDTVTFGRGKHCSVRLYYDCVSELHCTLTFSEENKAFLVVYGTNGLLVDGCQVDPTRSSNSGPTTVPLINGSEIEIYKKRFKFEYPPKEIRAALLATPRNAKCRRSLRMSMVRSAQVFTPQRNPNVIPHTPQKDSMDWNTLRGPIKVPSQDGSPEQEIALLEGGSDNVCVIEEDKDIIFFQKVDNQLQEEEALLSQPNTNRGHSVAFTIPSSTPRAAAVPAPQSARIFRPVPQAVAPIRRRSAPSLHRAVVLRSAQLALQREQQRFEEKQEEDEVEAEVSPERELGPFEVGDQVDLGTGSDECNEDDDDDDEEQMYEERSILGPSNALSTHPHRMTAFRKSLEAMRNIIPLPFNWKSPEEVPLPEDRDDDSDNDHEEQEKYDQDNGLDDQNDIGKSEDKKEPVSQSPIRRNLGPFMTPQVQSGRPQRVPNGTKARVSLSRADTVHKNVGGAQRVRVVPAWKVTDIVLPEPEKPVLLPEKKEAKERISEKERQAITARRISALKTPDNLPTPGPRTSVHPLAQHGLYTPGEDSDEDADAMVEKMRQKIINVRRQSEARKIRSSVRSRQRSEKFSLLASGSEHKNCDYSKVDINEETLNHALRLELDNQDVRLSPQAVRSPSTYDSVRVDPRRGCDNHQPATDTSGPRALSLTPRFDGVREMFRQTREEPKTPSFAGLRAMFKERSEITAKTPSLCGIKEMFSHSGASTVFTTPRLDLEKLFDEEDMDTNLADERETTDEDNVMMSTMTARSDHESMLTTSTKTKTKNQKTTAPSSVRRIRKKAVPSVGVPPVVLEEHSRDQEADSGHINDLEPVPATTVRRVARRTAKNATTPTAGDALPSDDKEGRGTLRSTRKAAPANSEGTTEVNVSHKTSKIRMTVQDDSEEPGEKINYGRSKGRHQQVTDIEAEHKHYRMEGPAKVKAGPSKVGEAETLENEDAAQPKPRRGRAAKSTWGRAERTEMSVPTTNKVTRAAGTEEVGESDPVPEAPKSRRGVRTKVAKHAEDSSPMRVDVQLSEAEIDDIAPPVTQHATTKKGEVRKTPVSIDALSEEKENPEQQQPKASDKIQKGRTRRAMATSLEALDAPAKRTRSRK